MKNLSIKIAALGFALFGVSCSSNMYYGDAYAIDDMYGQHNRVRIAQTEQARAQARKAEAEARIAELEALRAEAEYLGIDNNSYQGVLADTYESAYARRLLGFSSPTYRMPSSYYNLRYSGTYHYVSAYDPAFYNIVVMGDQVWVEPKYISSMFGTWGSPSYVTVGFGGGIWNNWYFSWGYNPYRYNWGYPGWGYYYGYNPYAYWGYPYYGGWHGPHHPGPGYRPHYRSNVVHRSQYRYGSGGSINSGSFAGNRGNTGSGYRTGTNTGSNSGSFRPGQSTSGTNTGSGNSSSFRNNNTTTNQGSSSYRGNSSSTNTGSSANRNNNSSSSTNRNNNSSGSYTRPNTSNPGSGSFSPGAGNSGSSSAPRGGNTSGRNSLGR